MRGLIELTLLALAYMAAMALIFFFILWLGGGFL
jgi:hypothetical protein